MKSSSLSDLNCKLLLFKTTNVYRLLVNYGYFSKVNSTDPSHLLLALFSYNITLSFINWIFFPKVLAERERRMNDGTSSRESSGDFSDLNKQNTALVTQHLVEEIRQAVNEANARGNS